jgi:glutathione-dependent peroxiredoxin
MNHKQVGDRIPEVTFRTRTSTGWQDVTTEDLFANKTVVVFSLPGAFTPTCSSSQLPGYNGLASVFKANGVDDILCVSVNDAFVMQEWQRSQNADNITMIPDGNGEFTAGMGMLVDKHDLGFGQRSWRYSMLVRDGVIEQLFAEPDKPGDPYEVSDPETMLQRLNPEAVVPDAIAVLTRMGCPHCLRAKTHAGRCGIRLRGNTGHRGAVVVRSVRRQNYAAGIHQRIGHRRCRSTGAIPEGPAYLTPGSMIASDRGRPPPPLIAHDVNRSFPRPRRACGTLLRGAAAPRLRACR